MLTRRFLNLALAALLATAFTSAQAQWPDYPTPGVPKTADGKPNLTGPVPRTADKHPDLTGVWEYYRDRTLEPTPPPPPPRDASLGLSIVAP